MKSSRFSWIAGLLLVIAPLAAQAPAQGHRVDLGGRSHDPRDGGVGAVGQFVQQHGRIDVIGMRMRMRLSLIRTRGLD